jgi:hypothetical protein
LRIHHAAKLNKHSSGRMAFVVANHMAVAEAVWQTPGRPLRVKYFILGCPHSPNLLVFSVDGTNSDRITEIKLTEINSTVEILTDLLKTFRGRNPMKDLC